MESTRTSPLKGGIGSSNFPQLTKSAYFVDKTLMLKTICELESNFILVTAPRRFGKSTNLNMVRTFFELKNDEIDKPLEERYCYELFRNLKIGGTDYKRIWDNFMGKYPIIKINFRCDIPISSYKKVVEECRNAICNAYKEHVYLAESPKLTSHQKNLCRRWINNEKFSDVMVKEGAIQLPEYLFLHFQKECFVLMDEYESICLHSLFRAPNEDMSDIISFTMGILNSIIKDNKYVERAFLTGISQICNLGTTGSNIFRYRFLQSKEFVNFYGFNEEEFDKLLCDNGISKNDELVKEAINMYNGYRYEDVTIFNTWAVVNFLCKREAESFWCDSGLVTDFRNNVCRIDIIKRNLENLLSEYGTVDFTYNTTTTYDELIDLKNICTFEGYESTNLDIFFTFLCENGYLTPINKVNKVLKVKLANREIKDQIYQQLKNYIISDGNLDFNLIEECAKLFDEIFLKLEFDSRIDCKEYLIKISEYIQNIFTSAPSEKINESYLHSILLHIAWQTSGKFLSNHKCGIKCNANKLDIAIYNGTYCIIIEAKYDRNVKIAMDQIFDKEYYTIFEFTEYFPNGVHYFILLGINLDREKNVSMNAVFNSTDKTTVPITIKQRLNE